MLLSQISSLTEGKDEDKDSKFAPKVKNFIEGELEKRVGELNEEFQQDEKEEVEQAYQKAMEAFEASVALRKPSTEKSVATYLSETRFLKELYEYLTRDGKEGYCLISGPELEDSLFVLTRMVETKMARRSTAGAEPEIGFMLETLSEMEQEHGSRLTAYAHSHPGKGSASTTPSSIDKDTQRKLEQGGYPAVGLIFSRDGYVRFFSHQREFAVEVSGNGEEVNDGVFKLS